MMPVFFNTEQTTILLHLQPVDIDILLRTSKPINPGNDVPLASLVLTEQHFQGVHDAALLCRITDGGVEQTDRRHDALVAGIGISLACLPANIQTDIHNEAGRVLYACSTVVGTSLHGGAQQVNLAYVAAAVHHPADAFDARVLVLVGATVDTGGWCDCVAETATSAARGDTHGGDLDVGVALVVLVVLREIDHSTAIGRVVGGHLGRSGLV